MRGFTDERHALVTRLSLEACRDRLRARLVAPLSLADPTEQRPCRGWVSRRGHFSLCQIRTHGTAFRARAKGTLVPGHGGTRILVGLGLREDAIITAGVLLGMTLVILLGGVVTGIGELAAPGGLLPTLPTLLVCVLLVLGTLAIGAWLPRFGRAQAAREAPFFLGFLSETLEAVAVETAGSSRPRPSGGHAHGEHTPESTAPPSRRWPPWGIALAAVVPVVLCVAGGVLGVRFFREAQAGAEAARTVVAQFMQAGARQDDAAAWALFAEQAQEQGTTRARVAELVRTRRDLFAGYRSVRQETWRVTTGTMGTVATIGGRVSYMARPSARAQRC